MRLNGGGEAHVFKPRWREAGTDRHGARFRRGTFAARRGRGSSNGRGLFPAVEGARPWSRLRLMDRRWVR